MIWNEYSKFFHSSKELITLRGILCSKIESGRVNEQSILKRSLYISHMFALTLASISFAVRDFTAILAVELHRWFENFYGYLQYGHPVMISLAYIEVVCLFLRPQLKRLNCFFCYEPCLTSSLVLCFLQTFDFCASEICAVSYIGRNLLAPHDSRGYVGAG